MNKLIFGQQNVEEIALFQFGGPGVKKADSHFILLECPLFELPCKTSYSSARETAWGRPENHENSLAEPGCTAILPKPVDE